MKTLLTLLTMALLLGPAVAQDTLDTTIEDLYYEARAQLRGGDYIDAAAGFERVADEDQDHELAPMALYWRAFALSREGDRANLLDAKETIERLFDRYPAEARRGDSAELAIEIRGQLARLGDADAAQEIAALADEIRGLESSDDMPYEVGTDRANEETRMAALNALLHTSPERAMPILRKILVERPDRYSAEFRERAVFLLSQSDPGDGETLETFRHVIDTDPDRGVREQAVFWVSQTGDERAVDMLEGIARDANADPEVRGKAIFALSQIGGVRANELLRDIALDPESSSELRANAVFWIGQSGGREAFDFLVQLRRDVDDAEIEDKALFAISQSGDPRAVDVFREIVLDENESTEHRSRALFWMSQLGPDAVDVDAILQLFRSVEDREIKDQAIFALSQMNTAASVDALIRIARESDDPEVRDRAIFWLGQSGREEALDFLTAILEEEF